MRCSSGENFVPRGVEAQAGDCCSPRAIRVNPAVDRDRRFGGKQCSVKVYHRPEVAIVATGDELVEIAETPGAAQIRNSNSYSIAAQVRRAGGEAAGFADRTRPRRLDPRCAYTRRSPPIC